MAEDRTVIATCNRGPAITTVLPVKEEMCSHPFDCFLREETVANGNTVLIPLPYFRRKLVEMSESFGVSHISLY